MILSYLLQLSLALLNIIFTAIYFVLKRRQYQKEELLVSPQKTDRPLQPRSRSPQGRVPTEVSPHLRNFWRYLSDFHKLQCYYSITLQIVATLIALYGPLYTTHSIRNPFDESFLLLSIDGILPVALMLYGLALFDKVTIYQVCLTAFSAVLASDTGITIVKLLSAPYGPAQRTRGSNIDWPATTGHLAPEAICRRRYKIKYPKKLRPEIIFLIGAVFCDALLIVIIVHWLFTTFPYLSPFRYLRKRFTPTSIPNRAIHFLGNLIGYVKISGHIAAACIFLYCTCMEYFFYYQMLVPQYDRIVNFHDWGFGQIVGIAVWAVVIIDLARHEICTWPERSGWVFWSS